MRCLSSYENMIVITQELARHESTPRPYAPPVSTRCFAAAGSARHPCSPILRRKRMIFRQDRAISES